MDYIEHQLIIWGIVVVVTIILSIIWYLYLKQISRFENLKREIAMSSIMICLIVANFSLLPILFVGYDITSICSQFVDELKITDSVDVKDAIPFVMTFFEFFAKTVDKIRLIFLFILPILLILIMLIFVVVITLKLREQKEKIKEKHVRKHLFEFNNEIIDSINKKRKR